ncbi:MAG: hypothetical protein ACRD2N_26775 [Vicinamibacterales bacterium]
MLDPELSDDEPVVTTRVLRQFAGIWLVFLGGLAAWSAYRGYDTRALVLAVLAVLIGPLGVVRPLAIRPLFTLLIGVTRPIGGIVTRVIVGFMFYGLFTPLALVFKLIGRDVLALKRRAGPNTYWTARQAVTDPRRYFRQ